MHKPFFCIRYLIDKPVQVRRYYINLFYCGYEMHKASFCIKRYLNRQQTFLQFRVQNTHYVGYKLPHAPLCMLGFHVRWILFYHCRYMTIELSTALQHTFNRWRYMAVELIISNKIIIHQQQISSYTNNKYRRAVHERCLCYH